LDPNHKDIRWRQRFVNLEKAWLQLDEALKQEAWTTLEKHGVIQRFECAFDLGWKTLKDFLESRGVDAPFPRDAIKQGFHYGVLQDGETWMEMLANRNLIAHTYELERSDEIFRRIRAGYSVALTQLYRELKRETNL